MAPPKFSWLFKEAAEELPRKEQSVARERDARPPAAPVRVASEPRSSTQPRPIRPVWTQLTLRAISALASICALVIAIYVIVGPIQRAWPVVFVSSIFTIILNTSEILALLQHRIPASLKIPRLHPIILIVADVAALGLLTWSFLVLFLDIYFGRKKTSTYMSESEPFVTVEMWLAAGIGFIHALLCVFDCIDCCSPLSPNSRVDELGSQRKPRGTSHVGQDVFEMDWG